MAGSVRLEATQACRLAEESGSSAIFLLPGPLKANAVPEACVLTKRHPGLVGASIRLDMIGERLHKPPIRDPIGFAFCLENFDCVQSPTIPSEEVDNLLSSDWIGSALSLPRRPVSVPIGCSCLAVASISRIMFGRKGKRHLDYSPGFTKKRMAS